MAGPAEVKDKATQKAVDVLVAKLRRRQIIGSRATALETVVLLRQVVASARFNTIDQLLDIVRGVGLRLEAAQPKETAVGGIVKKVMKVIQEEAAGVNSQVGSGATTPTHAPSEYSTASSSFPISSSPLVNLVHSGRVTIGKQNLGVRFLRGERSSSRLDQLLEASSSPLGDSSKKAFTMKPALIDAIQEVINELETVYENVAKNAREYIHAEDIVLTVGKSRTVESFLKSAARDRKFSVIVAETAPSYSGREMAASLAAAKISTVVVPDAALYSLMSRVNKVVLGAHCIQKNGGAFCVAGAGLAAMAARAHSTPVMICSGQFKLVPSWNLHQQYWIRDVGDPERVLDSSGEARYVPENVDVVNPWFEYVAPEFINVFITNYGDHPPAYVYKLVEDYFDEKREDDLL